MSEELEFINIEEGGQPPSNDSEDPHSRRKLRKKQNNQAKSFLRTLAKLVVVAGGILLICRLVLCPYAVHGNRMFPKLRDGDCAVVLKTGGFQKGDVVTYKEDGVRHFSRIVGTAGDTVSIGSDGFRVNGLLQSEEIFYETWSEKEIEVTVGVDEVYLLNDYRSNQTDSREFGSVKISEIDGKVIFLFRWRGI